MSERPSSRVNQILDLLVEEIVERIVARGQVGPPDALLPKAAEVEEPPPEPQAQVEVEVEKPPEPQIQAPTERHPLELEPEPRPELELPPISTGPSHAARLMGRLALGLLIAIVVINIPFNRHGTTLATALPDSAALVIVEGVVVKEEGSEDIYVFQNGQFRWISSMDAFEHYGFTWGDVHIVEDGYLDRFEKGPGLHVLLKCSASPHIYRLEGGKKRWIRDIAAFGAEGHVWEDVRFVSCSYLRNLPDGETIPPGSGPPPQP
jgi:hypothetical protein